MIKPVAVVAGDVVGVIAPSDAVDRSSVQKSAEIIENWGLKVKWGKHVFAKVGDFMAGTAEERQEDLRSMIFDPEIKVIWAATGGYAATEVLPVFNKETIEFLKKNPKWFVGYSDICLFLNALLSYNIVSLMGPSVWGLPGWDSFSQEFVRKMLFGEKVDGFPLKSNWQPAFMGEAEGKLVAADLETLLFSFGTRFDPLMYGSSDVILGIEELDIEKSTLQRQIDVIFNHKKVERIKGMIVGRLVNIKEVSYPEWGKKMSVRELVMSRVKHAGIPMAFCDDFGHAEWDYPPFEEIKKFFYNRRFLTVPNGIMAKLTVAEKDTKLQFLESICG